MNMSRWLKFDLVALCFVFHFFLVSCSLAFSFPPATSFSLASPSSLLSVLMSLVLFFQKWVTLRSPWIAREKHAGRGVEEGGERGTK